MKRPRIRSSPRCAQHWADVLLARCPPRRRARHTATPLAATRYDVGMNILLINHYAGSPRHGMEFRPYYLAREWVRQGHRVTIVASSVSHLRQQNPAVSSPVTREQIDGVDYLWLRTTPTPAMAPSACSICCSSRQRSAAWLANWPRTFPMSSSPRRPILMTSGPPRKSPASPGPNSSMKSMTSGH